MSQQNKENFNSFSLVQFVWKWRKTIIDSVVFDSAQV